jgi:hypothetical protein
MGKSTNLSRAKTDGLGLTVGCVATLRPLFRQVLKLGDSKGSQVLASSSGPIGAGTGLHGGGGGSSRAYGFKNNSRRTYREFDDGAASSSTAPIELEMPAYDKYGQPLHSTKISAGVVTAESRPSDSRSSSSSGRRMYEKRRHSQPADEPVHGIMVSRSVEVDSIL